MKVVIVQPNPRFHVFYLNAKPKSLPQGYEWTVDRGTKINSASKTALQDLLLEIAQRILRQPVITHIDFGCNLAGMYMVVTATRTLNAAEERGVLATLDGYLPAPRKVKRGSGTRLSGRHQAWLLV